MEQIFCLVWIIVTGDSVYFLLLLNDVIYIVNEYDIASIYFYALIVFTCRYLEDNFNYLQAIVISYCLSQFLVINNGQVKSSMWSITLSMPLSLSISPTNIKKPLVFWCFQGVEKEISGMKWVNTIIIVIITRY